MTFSVMKTSDLLKNGPTKVLLYAHHGWGKTHQIRHYAERYGKGLIISGESGLKSLEDCDIDYLPFSSWDGKHDPEMGVFSFRGIVGMLMSPDFAKAGYTWLAIDSLTEMSERLMEHLDREHKDNPNTFDKFQDYSRLMVGSLKWIRDLPIHVYVSCLAGEEKDHNDQTHFWPLVKGAKVSKQVPAIFDHVLCGVRGTDRDDKGTPRVRRYIITDEVGGWHGKVRDPNRRLRAQEPVDDITELLARMAMTDDEWAAYAPTMNQTPKTEKSQ